MSEPQEPNPERTTNPKLRLPCNRWNRSQRPPGQDHSLGFPGAQRASDNESSSTQSEIIVFQSPIIAVEEPRNSGLPSSTGLESIDESSTTEQPEPQGSQTPVFGTSTCEDDPWLASPDNGADAPNTPPMVQRNQKAPFNYGALIWSSLREGNDPWNED